MQNEPGPLAPLIAFETPFVVWTEATEPGTGRAELVLPGVEARAVSLWCNERYPLEAAHGALARSYHILLAIAQHLNIVETPKPEWWPA